MFRAWCRATVTEGTRVLSRDLCRYQSTHADIATTRALQSLSRLPLLQHGANSQTKHESDNFLSRLEQLHIQPSTLQPKVQARLQPFLLRPVQNIQPIEYKLPTVSKPETKRTILDPVKDHLRYDLPSLVIPGTEKFTPTTQIVPVQDPRLHPELPVIKKETMPYLVNIRKRKMKKHKLKKFRKRMIFLHRKLRDIKLKRKEKVLREIERSFATSAREFDAEKFVAERIKEAKRGGWKIDVIQRWQGSKTGETTQSDSR